MLLLVYSGTLELAGAPVVIVGVVAIYVLCFNALCYLIQLLHFFGSVSIDKFLIALAQSGIAAITLSECVMVSRVIFLWLKYIVSVKRSLLVDFMWHLCVQ